MKNDNIKKKREINFKKFELNANNYRGLLTSIRLFIAILTIIAIVFIAKNTLFKKNVVNYPLVYNKRNSLVLLTKKNDKVELSKEDSVRDVLYANKTNKYVLYIKNTSLYLYVANNKNESKKILNNVKKYYFSPNDKYIVSVDEDDNLYVYNYKKNEKIVSDIKEVKAVTNDDVIYLKDGVLSRRSLKVNKEEIKKVEKNFGKDVKLLNDKYLIYLDGNKALKLYNLAEDDNVKIDEDVSAYYSEDKVDEFYYLTLDGTIYYYDGSKSNKVANNIYDIANIDVLNREVVYSKYEDNRYTLYFQKGTKEASIIAKELKNSINYVYIFNNKAVYYINKDNELMFARINGTKVGKSRTVVGDVDVLSFQKAKNGYVFIADATKKGLGTLYITNSYKAKKIDSDVIRTNIKISNSGKDIYYYKNYAASSGMLYYSNGGRPKLIDEDVARYQYVKDKMIYYIKDYNTINKYGDLYQYTGKSKKIDDKVFNMANINNEYNK